MRREMRKIKKSKKGKNKTKPRRKRGEEEREDAGGFGSHFLERECPPSLYICRRSDRRIPS